MASNQTSNYGLNQWQAQDQILREEFNQDNAKTDAALAGLQTALTSGLAQVSAAIPRFAFGSYTGDGAASRTISVGFRPRAVYVCTQWGQTSYYANGNFQCYGGLALEGTPARIHYLANDETTDTDYITLTSGGFQVVNVETRGTKAHTNYLNEVYHYVAMR